MNHSESLTELAKAFWGEEGQEWILDNDATMAHEGKPAWKIHLQQMVLEEDPIKYLGRFL